MSITSSLFFLFLLLLLAVYYVTPKKYQYIILFLGNVAFYVTCGWKSCVFLSFTIISVWLGARVMDRLCVQRDQELETLEEKSQKKELKQKYQQKKKVAMLLVIVANFGILFVLKYANFLIQSVGGLFSDNISEISFSLLLPLGISFYTFQSAGYLIDCYREKVAAEKSLLKYATFASFFPQMIQGPIGRYSELAPQIFEGHCFDATKILNGIELMAYGCFKKMVIADRLSVITSTLFVEQDAYIGGYILIAAFAYTIQIYMDFSGGIDIVTGAAHMFGIELAKNFERPYFATDIPDFWRRWHITLGAWFRDYVFYPLSLSKSVGKLGKKGRKLFGPGVGKMIPGIFSQFVVFFLIGVWHGANIKYVLFGFYHGFFIVFTILFEDRFAALWQKLKINVKSFWWKLLKMVITFAIVMLGRIITQAPSVKLSVKMGISLFNNMNLSKTCQDILSFGLDKADYILILISCVIVFLISILQERGVQIREFLNTKCKIIQMTLLIIGIMFVLIFGRYGIGYSAADFVYKGF